jgi:hypothetical protein
MWHSARALQGSLGEFFVIAGDTKHSLLGFLITRLFGKSAHFLGALMPVLGIIDETCGHCSSTYAAGAAPVGDFCYLRSGLKARAAKAIAPTDSAKARSIQRPPC